MIRFIFIPIAILIWAIFGGYQRTETSEYIKVNNSNTLNNMKEEFRIIGPVLTDRVFGSNTLGDSVTIYKKDSNSQWKPYQRLVPNKILPDQKFGLAVDLDKNIALVSSLEVSNYYKSKAILFIGSVYVFKLNSFGKWVQIQKIYSPEMSAENNFGTSILLKNNYAIIAYSFCQTETNGDISKNIGGSNYLYTVSDTGSLSFVKKFPEYDNKNFIEQE